MTYQFEPIGVIHSCFKEKFGIPRQPGLVKEAPATLQLIPPYDRPEALQGLEGYSHLWITFVFHQSLNTPWRPMVRPPRLGGNKRIGVFATRSPVRPNPIGLSVVEIGQIDLERREIDLKGVDLLDGTPVLDIKPYLPYVDSIPDACGGFAPEAPDNAGIDVNFSLQALEQLQILTDNRVEQAQRLITQLLKHDPRPAYLDGNKIRSRFGMRLNNFNVRWQMEGNLARVTEISEVADS